ncbi:MAG: zinc ribbon domain-containing protein [Bacteroidia bacterium]|nr:zinc ribbon domain-containing protein [Bacteroidia bacterium]
MYCKNCGNEVHEKAVACPKCGVNPRSEKKFCHSCGTETNPNQAICTKCGVSLTNQGFSFDTANLQESLQKIDVNGFIKNKSSILALVALIGCFLPWLKVNVFMVSQSISGLGLSKVADYAPNTILISFLLYLFPICLLGFILSDFVPQISKYKRYFSIGSVLLIIYAGIGLYMAANPSTPEISKGGNDVFSGIMSSAQKMASDAISVSWGYYVSLLATIASFVFGMKK